MNTVAKINVGRLINKGSYGLGTAALKSRMTYTLYCGASDMIKPLGDLVVPGYRYKFTRHCLSLKNPDASIRTEAVKALVEIKSKEALPYIIPKLDDPDEGVQQEAVIAFGKLEDDQDKCTGKLLELFVEASNESVGKIAYRILLGSLSPDAIGSKVSVYLDEKMENRCYRYVNLYRLALENPYPSIQIRAIKTLVESKSKEALPILYRKFHDLCEDAQKEAVIAFGKLEDNQSKRIGKLLELFVDANNKSTVSKIACRILLESLSPEAIRSKVRVYLDEKANRCDTYRWFKLGFERHAENILKELCRSTGPNVS